MAGMKLLRARGASIFIFTQPDSDGQTKPYVHRQSVYQIQSYF